jgi:hypothetical protein
MTNLDEAIAERLLFDFESKANRMGLDARHGKGHPVPDGEGVSSQTGRLGWVHHECLRLE